MQSYVIVLIVFGSIFSLWGILSLISLLIYLIPQLVVRILSPQNLYQKYGGGYVFVTGGNSGIGEAFAKKVAKMGFNLIILGQDEERLNQVESELKEINQNIETKVIKADLSGDPVQVTEQIVQQLEGLDISIIYFNAGYGVFDDVCNQTKRQLNQFHYNIVTHQHIFQALYPKLTTRQLNKGKKRGAVLFTSSGLGIISTPGSVVYSATKAYMGHLGECLACEANLLGLTHGHQLNKCQQHLA
ncbi:MAG: putative short-chain dehydrogenase [Streblomastix strix]|uniref:Putative short-chain dehydrogenase n=1 Tax=Streblomastix strix TaxID=222440 RepID=A0A5J4TKS7_9EUKA|nr:MAG: putative short-chain dehydrogenase [Streblomastix strix]